MGRITVDPDANTISATQSLRPAGGSHTLTIPPEVLQAIKAERGDDLRLVAHMDTGVLEVTKVEDGESEE